MTFYLKYRPQKIEELDIAPVRESLGAIVKSGRIPQAFLFSGPKGTGKTSAGRILAKIVNCENNKKLAEPCNRCDQCLATTKGTNIDVIELDAASHRGIDDVRLIRDAVKLAPAKAKKKVYIIDEAHMLTPEASNALLKTLEEPPAHVFFILATTNPEKLLETIRSRIVNINFRKATADEIVRSLGRVVKGEKIKIETEALALIALAANGSFRDAAKTLELMLSEGRSLVKDKVEQYLFQTKIVDPKEFFEVLINKDVKKALGQIEKISLSGGSIPLFLEQTIGVFRANLLAKVGVGTDEHPEVSKQDLLALIDLFTHAAQQMKGTLIEELPTEIAVIKWCARTEEADKQELPVPKQDKQNPDEVKIKKPAKSLKEVSEEVWKSILAQVKPINTSIEALLRAAKPIGFDGKNMTLGVFYRFHKERLEDVHHRRILEEVIESVLGTPVRVICTLTEPPARPVPVEKPEAKAVLTEGEDKDIIKIAEEIFGN